MLERGLLPESLAPPLRNNHLDGQRYPMKVHRRNSYKQGNKDHLGSRYPLYLELRGRLLPVEYLSSYRELRVVKEYINSCVFGGGFSVLLLLFSKARCDSRTSRFLSKDQIVEHISFRDRKVLAKNKKELQPPRAKFV